MKTINSLQHISTILIVIVSSFIIFSCNNSFLNETEPPEYNELYDTIYVTNNSDPFLLNLDFNTIDACNWSIIQFPYWLEPSTYQGKKKINESATIQFVINDNKIAFDLGFYSFPLVFDIEGKQLVGYTIALANLGFPEILISNNQISLNNSLNYMLGIENTSYGLLNWWVASAPDWLETDTNFGLIDPYQNQTLRIKANLNGLDPGEYQGVLVLASNASNHKTINIKLSLTVKAKVYYGEYYKGQLIDTRFSKNREEVIVLTKSPNQLIFFGKDLKPHRIIDLDRHPQSIAFSEDESTIAVGYTSSEITLYNAVNYNIIKNLSIGNIPISIEFANENYLYYIANYNNTNYLHSLNLETENIIRGKDGESGMKTLNKVPGKSILISSQPGYSPDGLILFDISQAGQTDSINKYFMDLNGYWISDDGENLYSGWKNIYKIPNYVEGHSYFPQGLNSTNKLNFESSQIVDYISNHSASQRIFVAFGYGGEDSGLQLKVYNSNTLAQQKEYEIKYSRPNFFPINNYYWGGRPIALYPSNDEKHLWIIQKHAEYSYDDGIWSVSKADITK